MLYGTEYFALRVARKEHDCAYGVHCTIKAGEQYIDAMFPPWYRVQDDPDGSSPLGRWQHDRFHARCHADTYYGTWLEQQAAVAQAGPGGTDGGM